MWSVWQIETGGLTPCAPAAASIEHAILIEPAAAGASQLHTVLGAFDPMNCKEDTYSLGNAYALP